MADEAAQVSSRSHQVDALLSRKDKVGALSLSLQNPPVNADKAVKVQYFLLLSFLCYLILITNTDSKCRNCRKGS
jgi:hypothetical protein